MTKDEAILLVMQARPMTTSDLAKAFNVRHESMSKRIVKLYDAQLIHVGGWEWCRNGWVAKYAAGKGIDKPRPGQASRPGRIEISGSQRELLAGIPKEVADRFKDLDAPSRIFFSGRLYENPLKGNRHA